MPARNRRSSLFGVVINDEEKSVFNIDTCGLYYKPMTIVSDDSRVANKLEASFTDDARVVLYDHHMFIVQANRATVI
jgi:hypothetical protein